MHRIVWNKNHTSILNLFLLCKKVIICELNLLVRAGVWINVFTLNMGISLKHNLGILMIEFVKKNEKLGFFTMQICSVFYNIHTYNYETMFFVQNYVVTSGNKFYSHIVSRYLRGRT